MSSGGATRGHRAAVVGGGLGGLSAAFHLARSGYEVDLFEKNDTVGGRANRLALPGTGGSYLFDTGPSLLNYPWLFEELFRRGGRELAEEVELLPVEPALSFRWRDGSRFALSSDYERLAAECEQLAPGSRAGLTEFLHDAAIKYRVTFDKLVTRNEDNPARWLMALSVHEAGRLALWRSLYGELARFFDSPKICQALGCYAMYLGGSPFELPGFFSLLPFGELAHGLWLPRGGIYSLVEGMERLAEGAGVRVHTGRGVGRIETDAMGRVRGLGFETGERGEWPVVVSNVDLPTTDTALLTHPRGASARRRRAEGLQMTPGVVTFYWGLRNPVRGLDHHTVFLPDDYRAAFAQLSSEGRIPDDLPFYVAVASETDPGLAPPGGSTLFVLVPTPVLSHLGRSGPPDWPALVDELRARVLARLAHHGLVLEAGDPEVEEVWTPVEWSRRFGLWDGSAFGAAHGFFQVGPFRPRNASRTVPGLFYAGASTTPGTGMPMVTLSGQLVAERVAALHPVERRLGHPGTGPGGTRRSGGLPEVLPEALPAPGPSPSSVSRGQGGPRP